MLASQARSRGTLARSTGRIGKIAVALCQRSNKVIHADEIGRVGLEFGA
jgi:hypothetical protein